MVGNFENDVKVGFGFIDVKEANNVRRLEFHHDFDLFEKGILHVFIRLDWDGSIGTLGFVNDFDGNWFVCFSVCTSVDFGTAARSQLIVKVYNIFANFLSASFLCVLCFHHTIYTGI